MSTEPETREVADLDEVGFLTSTKLYIVIACIAALVLVAIVQAGCTIYKMAKKPSHGSKVSLISLFNWHASCFYFE